MAPRSSNEIPDNWCLRQLSEVSYILYSNVDKRSLPRETPVRLCNYLDVYDNLQITSDLDFMEATASRDEILRFAVQPGDVVMTKDSETPDDIGVPAVCVESISDLVCGYHLALIRPIQEEVDASFLADQIAHRRIGRYFRLHANGTTRFGLTTSTIEDTPLWLPPLGEQRHIAEILDAADEAIRRTERVIAKLKEIKKGLLHDLLTRGLDTEGNLRDPEAHPEQFKDSPVGTIPRGWTAATLGDVVSQTKGFIQTGPFGSQLHADEYTREGIPVVMPQNIENGRVRGRDVARVAPETARALARHRVTDNDVVFARRGDLSRCASIGEREEGWLCGTGCLLVRSPRDEISGDWLAAVYRNTLCQRQIHENAVGSTMVNLNTSLLASLIIPKPPYPEQLSIVEAIATYDTPIRAEESMLHKLREVKRGLMDDLLTGRLRV